MRANGGMVAIPSSRDVIISCNKLSDKTVSVFRKYEVKAGQRETLTFSVAISYLDQQSTSPEFITSTRI